MCYFGLSLGKMGDMGGVDVLFRRDVVSRSVHLHGGWRWRVGVLVSVCSRERGEVVA